MYVRIVRVLRVYFTDITHTSTSFCVGGSSSSDFEESQGSAATATLLLDAPKLSKLGIIKIVSIIPYVLEKCGIE